jgi:hypothetical protein
MFHAISARLARLARRIASRLAAPSEFAAWHGWQARQIRRGTTEYRDPRFTYRKIGLIGLSTGCDHCDSHVADALDNARPDNPASRLAAGTWAQQAIIGRLRALSAGTGPREFGRGA